MTYDDDDDDDADDADDADVYLKPAVTVLLSFALLEHSCVYVAVCYCTETRWFLQLQSFNFWLLQIYTSSIIDMYI